MAMSDVSGWSGRPADLSACEQEPIHVPGSIQPHGALFVVDTDTLCVEQVAVGDQQLGCGADADIIGRPLGSVLPNEAAALLETLPVRLPESGSVHIGLVHHGEAAYHLIAHRNDAGVIVELERAAEREPASFDEIYPYVRSCLESLRHSQSIEALAELAAREIRRLTGLDRALVYRFDEQWNGEVIAENRGERLSSYLGLRFPASDIPAPARELYRINRLRLIADAAYEPAPIKPAISKRTGRPVDLTHAVLRSVSPVHLEYMRNMGTMASMSISLLRGDRLWGLISCHNREPARVPYHVRMACDFIGQVLSLQIAAHEASAGVERRDALRAVQRRLLAHMAGSEHFIDGLVSYPDDLLALTDASGAAIVSGRTCHLVGQTPSQAEVRKLVEWLARQERQDLFCTSQLPAVMPEAEGIKNHASGVLAISISQIHDSYVLWFRPELVRTLSWGGDPYKPADSAKDRSRLHPRTSFERWQETVRLTARPWHEAEVEAASELRAAVVDIVLRKAEEMAALSEKLVNINRELEAFSYSVSHDLRAPFRHIVGYAQLLKKFEGNRLSERGSRYLDTIVESAISAGTLVDELLSFSQMGRATLRPVPIDMNELVSEVKRQLVIGGRGEEIEWRVAPLPPVRADPMMLRLVVQNLLDNAMKFSRNRHPPLIEVGCMAGVDENIYFVRDNGSGFDMAYVGKLFGVFQRLHRVEEFEGTGIGLANVKRIVERHGGRVWAESQLDQGATFFFALPKPEDS